VPDVPEDLVAGRFEQAVQHRRQLAGAEVGAEVPADLADHVNDQLARLLRDLSQLCVGTSAKVLRAVDGFEQAGGRLGPVALWFGAHRCEPRIVAGD
jgi:hypothetical protein